MRGTAEGLSKLGVERVAHCTGRDVDVRELRALVERVVREVLSREGDRGVEVPKRKKTRPGIVLAIVGGKGGTGKTTVAVNLAVSLRGPLRFFDGDVEEPDAYLFLRPIFRETVPVEVPVPQFDLSRCTYCGACAEFCRFNAIAVARENLVFFEGLCRSCGGCAIVCPAGAISPRGKEIGQVWIGETGEVRFFGGRLVPGEQMVSPILWTLAGYRDDEAVNIVDGPPGTRAGMIEAVWGADYCLLVTEPTPLGLHDLVRSAEVLGILGIPYGVVLNKDEIGDGRVEQFCEGNQVPILLRIPYDRDIAALCARGIPFAREDPGWAKKFGELFRAVQEEVS